MKLEEMIAIENNISKTPIYEEELRIKLSKGIYPYLVNYCKVEYNITDIKQEEIHNTKVFIEEGLVCAPTEHEDKNYIFAIPFNYIKEHE